MKPQKALNVKKRNKAVSTRSPKQNNAYLGRRAKNRRCSLLITQRDAAKMIGTEGANLCRWEQRLPARHGGCKEDKWEEILRVPRGWLRNGAIRARDAKQLPGWLDRKALARRAAARRRDLKIPRSVVAKAIGLSNSQLIIWETTLAKNPRVAIERRWEAMLRVPRGWLRKSRIPTPKVSLNE